MCLLFESIRVEDQTILHLPEHLARMNHSRSVLFSSRDNILLSPDQIPLICGPGIFKLKIIYDTKIQSIELSQYQKRNIKIPRLIFDDTICYPHKFLERRAFDKVKREFPEFDEYLFVKDGMITDSSFSNLAFLKDETWFTPASCLLPGTRRNRLIENRTLTVRDIHPADLQEFSHVSYINAMLDIGELQHPVERIYY